MKKISIIFTMVIGMIACEQIKGQDYKYCELVGYSKFPKFWKIKILVDSGGAKFASDKFIKDEDPKSSVVSTTKNEKFYVDTDQTTYEGKTVQVDSKGKYIWKKVETSEIKEGNVKNKEFNTMIDGLNYMGDRGWELVNAYLITMGKQNVYHYVMKKKK